MKQFIGCDQHKHYSVFAVRQESGGVGLHRMLHDAESVRRFLEQLPAGSEIAVETSGYYYWLVDEMERAGHRAHLAHALHVKRLNPSPNKKFDGKDACHLLGLLQNGSLPEVWIPSAGLRDQREVLRLRMFLCRQRTQMKNRIHGCLGRYNVHLGGTPFSGEWRLELSRRLEPAIPEHTRQSLRWQLSHLDLTVDRISTIEKYLDHILYVSPEVSLLRTLPCTGKILAATIALEAGRIERFPSAEHYASYCGLVPRVSSSGGKTRMGQTCNDVNRFLKWAYVEMANLIVRNRKTTATTHALRLYNRIKKTKSHPKAVVAMGRHLAEATFWMLTNQEPYRPPRHRCITAESESQHDLSSTHG